MNIESSIAMAGALIAVFVSIINAMYGAKKSELEVLRGIIAELRTDNTNLKASVKALEQDKASCLAALAELQKLLLPKKTKRAAAPDALVSVRMSAPE